jgi:predicted AAA+ superfamily ATPase
MSKITYNLVMKQIFTRKISVEIEKWFMDSNLVLLINGARQIGKTETILNFINSKISDEYRIFIDFSIHKDLFEIFENYVEPEKIISSLKLKFPNKIFDENKTIIFFDEIQLFAKAMSCLKPFVKTTKYKIICSGSLLTLKISDNTFYPTGSIEHLAMYPMDFEEFL